MKVLLLTFCLAILAWQSARAEFMDTLINKGGDMVSDALCLKGIMIQDYCVPTWAVALAGTAGGIVVLLAVTGCCCCCFRPCRSPSRAPAGPTIVMTGTPAYSQMPAQGIRGMENPGYGKTAY